MKSLTLDTITELQCDPNKIRNICILAHVDHGKTTLADTLVASNGIISQRMAGKLRYLDSREDEQIRGITMKSSAISLVYNKDGEDTLINLIDSPGHIDFSSEVSTAVRLCDGAIVLVDVVEGICPQTHAVLRQAWLENIKPVLVLNKIDRLITELKMSPIEAHIHLQHILQRVNAITGELFTSEVLEKTSNQAEMPSQAVKTDEHVFDWSSGLEETDDSNLYFSPDQGNVVFASAIDGWGFGIHHFAQLYAAKLGINASVLEKTLWGDFYLEMKTKRIKKGAQAKSKKPLFVNFILENLWAVYEAVIETRDKDMIDKIVKSLKLKIPPRDSRHSDPRVLLQSLCSQWLPLSKAVLEMVVNTLPTPKQMPEERAEKLLCSRAQTFDALPKETQSLKNAFLSCSSEDNEPIIIYVSKLFPVERKHLPQHKPKPLTQEQLAGRREFARKRHAEKYGLPNETKEENQSKNKAEENIESKMTDLVIPAQSESEKKNLDEQVFIAFARVFSGKVRKGQKLYILNPKHDPEKALIGKDDESQKYISEIEVEDLYLFMGRELEALEFVAAGNIVGIGGLEEYVLKSATLADTLACPSFTDMYFEAAPIVRVAVEATNAADMPKLSNGLKLLNQADPSVEILIQETGEQVIIAAGEVHLQKCIDDLTDRFAKVQVNVSPPIVPFRETIIPIPKFDRRNEAIDNQTAVTQSKIGKDTESDTDEDEEDEEVLEDGLIEIQTANRLCSFTIRAIALPPNVIKLIEENSDTIKLLDQYSSQKSTGENSDSSSKGINTQTKEDILKLKSKLQEAFNNCEKDDKDLKSEFWNDIVDQIWCFGPRKVGPNVLINRIPDYNRPSIWTAIINNSFENSKSKYKEYDYCIISGFQMATLSGPLCEESMHGVCFVLESWEQHQSAVTLKERKQNIEEKPSQSNNTSEDKSEDIKAKDEIVETNNEFGDSDCDPSSPTQLSPGSPPESLLEKLALSRKPFGPLSGQLMSTIRQGCRRAFQTQPQRLMWAMYTCDVQAEAEILGKMYAVLSKRHGRILDEDMKQGTSVFNINAVLPVVESFGFAEEIRKRTSGMASPQLKFSHWEVIDIDPFWVPTTEEEYMHFGEKADSANVARKYMNNVRRRKGLFTNEKLVEFGTKQRTLTRNK